MRLRRATIYCAAILVLGLALVFNWNRQTPRPKPRSAPPATSARAAAAIRATPGNFGLPAANTVVHHVSSLPNVPPALPVGPVLEEGLVTFRPALKERLFAPTDDARRTIRVQLLGGEAVPVQVTRHEILDEHSGVIHGEAADEPGSQVLLAYVDEAVAGTLFFPKRGLYQIRHVGDGQHRVVKLDPAWMPPCGVGDQAPTNDPSVAPVPLGTARLDKTQKEWAAPASRIGPGDVLVRRAIAPPVASDAKPVTLAWSPSPDATVTGYKLYHGEVSGTQTNKLDVGTALTATLANLRAGATYFFFATAYDANGTESVPSNFVTYTPVDSTTNGNTVTNSAPATSVDILVAYTTITKEANGGDAGIAALINSSIAMANSAFNNSDAGVTLRLAAKVEVNYTDSGDLTTDLPRLQNTADGHLDELATLRDAYKADLVCLLVHSGGPYSGLAYVWTAGASSAAFAPWACSVVVDSQADAYLTLAHEVGHNFGCGHAPGDGGAGAFGYSNGYRFTVGDTQYRTVMAYAPGTRIPYFSNPNVNYLGVATGSATADNAQTIRNSSATIAGIQTGSTLYQEWVPIAATPLDQDAQPDMIWRNSTTGRVIVWYMSGTNVNSIATLWSGDANWTPITAERVDGLGADIVWRNSASGRVIAWLRNGGDTQATEALWTGDPAWVPRAAGDFNSDGVADLVWRNATTGRVIIWFMGATNGTDYNVPYLASTAAIWTGDPAWQPMTTGDFNGDGKADLVWRNATTGRVIVWFMDGGTNTGTAVLWAGDSRWVPVTTGDFNADGNSDLIWRNTATGRVIIWFMNGTTQLGTAAIWG